MAVELATAYVTLIPSAVGIASAIKAQLGGAEMTAAATAAGSNLSKGLLLSVSSQAAKTGEAAGADLVSAWTGATSRLASGTDIEKSFQATGQKAGRGFSSGFSSVTKLLAAVGIAEIFKTAVKGAADFQSETELLVTAGGEAQSALGSVRSGIESIAVATGTSLSQLASGMYILEKAGIRGADGLTVLKVAAEGARAENVDLATMTNALTSIMRSYNLPASQATSITNQLVAASGAAKTTMAEFAGSLSTVLPIASSAGLSFAQVGGAIATLTSHGTSADEATQELANTIRSLQAPNQVAINEMAQFGLNSNTVSVQLGKRGLTGTLTELTQAITAKMGPAGLVLFNAFNQSQGAAADMRIEMSKMPPALQALAQRFAEGKLTMNQWRTEGRKLPADQKLMVQGFMATYTQAHKFNQMLTSGSPAAQTYAAALSKMLGGATGLTTALMLTGGSAATFANNVATVSAAAKLGGSNISTWTKTQGNFNVQMGRLGEIGQTTAVTIGSSLLPKLTAFGSFMANHVGVVKTAAVAVTALGTAMLVGAIALKAFTVAEGIAKVLTGEETAATGLQVLALVAQKAALIASSVATAALAAATAVLNAIMDANPIVLTVIALAALVAGLVLAYQHSATFRAILEDVWKFLRQWGPLILTAVAPVLGIPLLIWQHWSLIVGYAKTAFNDVWSFLKQWGPLILTAIFPVLGIPLLIWQHWTQALGVFKSIGSFFSGIGRTIVAAISTGFDAVLGFFTALPGRIVAGLKALPHLLVVAAEDAIAGFIVGLAYQAIGIWKFFTELLPTAILAVGRFGVALTKLGVDMMTSLLSGLVTAGAAVIDFFVSLPGREERGLVRMGTDLYNLGKSALVAMSKGILTAAVAVDNFFIALPGRILRFVVRINTDLLNLGRSALVGMASGVAAGAVSVFGFVAGIPKRIIGALGNVTGTLTGSGSTIMDGLFNGITGAFFGVVSWFASLPGTIGGLFKGCVNWLFGAGEQIMNGLLNGITSGLNGVKNFVTGIASKIVSWKGPPAYDATILIGNGKLIMQGLMNGIRSQMPSLQSTLGAVTAIVAGGVGVAHGSASAPLAPAPLRSAPLVGSIEVTAYDPAEAARKTAAEIGWLNLTRGQ